MNRNDCYSDLDLAAYLDGWLSRRKREAIEDHLARHDECRKDLQTIRDCMPRDLTPEEDAPAQLVQNVVALYPVQHGLLDIVISLASDALAVLQASLDVHVTLVKPAFTLRNRGSQDSAMLAIQKKFDTVTADLNIERLSERKCNIWVILTDSRNGARLSSLRVELLAKGRVLGSHSLVAGAVLFEDVDRGLYDLMIQKNEEHIGTIAIKIQ